MRLLIILVLASAAGTALLCSPALGQEKASVSTDVKSQLASYDVSREATILGTVQAYTPVAQTPPLGAHVSLLTTAGVVDVHLGDARLLAANHFSIQSGDTLRIIGEYVTYGKSTQFVARIVQNGTRALAVRSVRGIPFSYMAPRNAAQSKSQGGVL
jgi:hypothetical protein